MSSEAKIPTVRDASPISSASSDSESSNDDDESDSDESGSNSKENEDEEDDERKTKQHKVEKMNVDEKSEVGKKVIEILGGKVVGKKGFETLM